MPALPAAGALGTRWPICCPSQTLLMMMERTAIWEGPGGLLKPCSFTLIFTQEAAEAWLVSDLPGMHNQYERQTQKSNPGSSAPRPTLCPLAYPASFHSAPRPTPGQDAFPYLLI